MYKQFFFFLLDTKYLLGDYKNNKKNYKKKVVGIGERLSCETEFIVLEIFIRVLFRTLPKIKQHLRMESENRTSEKLIV